MIAARKNRALARLLVWDSRRRIQSTFAALRVRGFPSLQGALAEAPVLVVANHTAWWDPLVAIVLAAASGAEAYAMMDAINLRRLPFFAAVGAFGVDLTDPADGARAVRYAASHLDRPGRLVWIFPQGREVPVTTRPHGFRGGAARIARMAQLARVVPVAIRYEFGAQPKPTAWASFGEPLATADGASREAQELGVTTELSHIEAAVHGHESQFASMLGRRGGWLDAWSERALARLTRRLLG